MNRAGALAAAMTPLAAAAAAAAGRLYIHPDQWREWLGAAGTIGAVGSSAFGAVSPVYRAFVPPAWFGGEPQAWWGISWLLLLATLPIVLKPLRQPHALLAWTVAIALPPAAYWLDNHAITASVSYGAAALALALLAGGAAIPAVWAGALALAAYPVGGPLAAAIGLVALRSAPNPAARRRVLRHGVAAAAVAVVPYALAARDAALSRGSAAPLGDAADALAFLAFGPVPALVLVGLTALAWWWRPGARPVLAVAAANWLLAALLLPAKTDWWAGYYPISTVGLLLAALAAALPRPRLWQAVAAVAGVAVVAALAARPEWRMSRDAHWQAARPSEPNHMAIGHRWALFESMRADAGTRRAIGEAHTFLRWAREHRGAVAVTRPEVWVATTLPATTAAAGARCDAQAGPICRYAARTTDTLRAAGPVQMFHTTAGGAPAGAAVTIAWHDCATTAPASRAVTPNLWVHQTTVSVAAAAISTPRDGCLLDAATRTGEVWLVAADRDGRAWARRFDGKHPYAFKRF